MVVAEMPETALRLAVVPLRTAVQLVPSQRMIVPLSPTAQMSVAEGPHSPLMRTVVLLVAALQAVPSHLIMRDPPGPRTRHRKREENFFQGITREGATHSGRCASLTEKGPDKERCGLGASYCGGAEMPR